MYLANAPHVCFNIQNLQQKIQNMPAIEEVLHQGRYRITRRLGQNGTGEIYEAYDNQLETSVILKENLIRLKKVMTLAQQQNLKLAFAGEAKALTEIKHESFQQIHDYFSEIDRTYLVLEPVEGDYLSELFNTDATPFSLSDIMEWVEQLLDAISYLHALTPQVIYGNLKPQNIKLLRDGKIKILASGLAGNQTKSEMLVMQNFDTANLHYLPLEQIWEKLDSASQKVILNDYDEKSEKILKQPPDARSDIYALGATVYFLLTGRQPIDALERSIDILEGKPDSLPLAHEVNSDVPPEISEVLSKALEIKRENRFDSALIMRQVLRTAFVRIEEREAEEAKLREASLPKISAEQQAAIIEQEKQKAIAEQERQIELIKQQLQEAETQRLLAEQRAAEAEKLLLRKEKTAQPAASFEEKDSFAEHENLNPKEIEALSIPKSREQTVSATKLSAVVPETVEFNVPQANSSDGYENLFSGVQRENKSKRWMTAVAMVVITLGSAAFGIWFVIQSKSAESNQVVPDQAVTSPAGETIEPEPIIEPAPSPVEEVAPEEDELPVSSQPNFTEGPVKKSWQKNKSLSPPARAKKQTAPQAKTPPSAQKNTVTVDDIISDN